MSFDFNFSYNFDSPSTIQSKFPIAYIPIFALLNATHTLLKVFKNPISLFLLLLTKLNNIISFSSP